ncbi:hypothetical protein P7K49_011919 [Saguinus oedipus]|uniref:Basic proline-rich protein-like n=1 Tax=Saguinus oedipus TaxID=9490 RepID=A0ABQ9VS12_SAGOE|nr:hypothetical protein P7K49_011919 [Saguinus oedipus]
MQEEGGVRPEPLETPPQPRCPPRPSVPGLRLRPLGLGGSEPQDWVSECEADTALPQDPGGAGRVAGSLGASPDPRRGILPAPRPLVSGPARPVAMATAELRLPRGTTGRGEGNAPGCAASCEFLRPSISPAGPDGLPRRPHVRSAPGSTRLGLAPRPGSRPYAPPHPAHRGSPRPRARPAPRSPSRSWRTRARLRSEPCSWGGPWRPPTGRALFRALALRAGAALPGREAILGLADRAAAPRASRQEGVTTCTGGSGLVEESMGTCTCDPGPLGLPYNPQDHTLDS